MAIRKPMNALKPKEARSALGRVEPASLTSSLIWTAQSKPIEEMMGLSRPTIVAVPLEFQPPPLVNWVHTVFASAVGARVQSVIKMATIPRTWRINSNPSTKGNFFASTVLKKMAKEVIAMMSRVPCHAFAT